MPRLRALTAAMVLAVLAGCGPSGLRTYSAPPSGPPIVCTASLITPFTLQIDVTKSDPVWGVWQATGERFEIVWPPGFRLENAPGPVLVDTYGEIVGRHGMLIDNAGGTGSDGFPWVICGLGEVEYPLRPASGTETGAFRKPV